MVPSLANNSNCSVLPLVKSKLVLAIFIWIRENFVMQRLPPIVFGIGLFAKGPYLFLCFLNTVQFFVSFFSVKIKAIQIELLNLNQMPECFF